MNTEQLIREALAAQAERAPDPDRLLMRLRRAEQASARHEWRRRTALALAAAGAVAAVAVPAVLSMAPDAPRDTPAGSSPSSGPAQATRPAIPMRFTARWLPDGLVEGTRHVWFENAAVSRLERTWRQFPVPTDRTPDGPYVSLVVHPAGTDIPRGEPVDVNGAAGVVAEPGTTCPNDPNFTCVVWSPDGRQVLEVVVFAVPDAVATAVRAARSVVPDTATLESAATFGWLPAGMRQHHEWIIGTSVTEWDVDMSARSAPRDPANPASSSDVTVWINRSAAGGSQLEPVTVRGRAGSFHDGSRSEPFITANRVSVQLEDGRWLHVSGGLSKEDMIRVADTLVIWPADRYEWIGRR